MLVARNGLTRVRGDAKEALSGVQSDCITWYTCGPTVYDDAHLGHARTFVSFDIARRLLSALAGVRVDLCVGVTDIDDKIVERARASGMTVAGVARKYERRFFDDMRKLQVLPPTRVARVTEHVAQIVDMVGRLVENGAAYVAGGDVYFSVARVGEAYGKLDMSRVGACQNGANTGKRDTRDFALWKGAPSGGCASGEEATFESPWGVGRPGWHVECVAMAKTAFGDAVDVHSGGIDLRFPHHTNELAIAHSLLGAHQRRWANTWLHAGHLHIQGRKMSKSVKNFETVRHYLAAGGTADAFRMFCLQHRYGAPVEYTRHRVRDAEQLLARLRGFVAYALDDAQEALVSGRALALCERARALAITVSRARDAVTEALVDDFDTPRAMAHLNTLVSTVHREARASAAAALVGAEAAHLVADTLRMAGVSGFSEMRKRDDDAVELLVGMRSNVRKAAAEKDWARVFEACDEARRALRDSVGVDIRDGSDGKSTWCRI